MNTKQLLVNSLLCLALSACGGGGGGSGSGNTSLTPATSSRSATMNSSSNSLSSSSSSSSSLVSPAPSVPNSSSSNSTSSDLSPSSSSLSNSSQANGWSAADCSFSNGGAVFIDKVCAGNTSLKFYEYTQSYTGGDRSFGDTGQLINMRIIESGDNLHHQVLDIAYNHAAFNGGVYFQLPGTDLQDYSAGSLEFDLKVLSRGDAQSTINYKVACAWPCGSTEIHITPTQLGQWQTISIPIADLIMRGLDLSRATNVLELLPTWDSQAGVHYQLDNIRWIKDSHAVTQSKCYSQHFDRSSTVNLDDLVTNTLVPQSLLNITSGAEITVVPKWSRDLTNWGFSIEHTYDTSACGLKATLSADIYVAQRYVDDGSLQLGLYVKDNFGKKTLLGNTVSVVGMKGDDWNHLSQDLSGLANLNQISYMGVVVYANGKPEAVTGKLAFDNIVLSRHLESTTTSASSLPRSSSLTNSSYSASYSSKSLPGSASSASNSVQASSSSSSSSTASAPISTANCNILNGEVFVDGLCQGVGQIGIYQQSLNKVTPIHDKYTEQGNIALTLFTEAHETPQRIKVAYGFGLNGSSNTQIALEMPEQQFIDLTGHANGKLEFDIKVNNYGSASNTATPDDKLIFSADCGWPCGTSDITVRPTARRQWQTISIDAAELTLSGLDLSKVHTLFQLMPAWGSQFGASFEVANIRWKANGGRAAPNICYGKYFFSNTNNEIQSQVLDPSGGTAIQLFGTSFVYFRLYDINWASPSRIFGLGFSADSNFNSCAYSGTLHYQIYLPATYINDGKLKVGVVYTDIAGKHAYLPATSVAGLRANEWNSLSIPLSNTPFVRQDAGFDANHLAYFGPYLDANGKDPAVNGYIYLDNFIFTH